MISGTISQPSKVWSSTKDADNSAFKNSVPYSFTALKTSKGASTSQEGRLCKEYGMAGQVLKKSRSVYWNGQPNSGAQLFKQFIIRAYTLHRAGSIHTK